jgi:hypothetical protein
LGLCRGSSSRVSGPTPATFPSTASCSSAHCGLQVSQQCGFLIYLADAFGYLGSVLVLFYKDFFVSDLDWVTFFTYACYGVSASGVLFTTAALVYFQRKKQEMRV